ncbi:MAG: hypothetical protein MI810_13495 [Flavobacteriales bacterium]|nr:hypothetical protein [Flavobacteriales bacterium]
MKLLNVFGIIASVALFFFAAYFILETAYARVWASEIPEDNYAEKVTLTAATYSLFFTLFFLINNILNRILIKTTTTKVISYFGISFSVILLPINIYVLMEPTKVSYDESGLFWLAFSVIMFPFSIVYLVQVNRYGILPKSNPEILDDFNDSVS